MLFSLNDMQEFYAARSGAFVRHLVRAYIRDFWPDIAGLDVLGYGYIAPYADLISRQAGRFSILVPASQARYHWPGVHENAVFQAEASEIPLESNTIDRLLIVHGLEHAEMPAALLEEAWRVLKGEGRLIVVVPNRIGLWCRADWSPFGYGVPYSAPQLKNLLTQKAFDCCRQEQALFVPPFQSGLIMKSALTFEKIGRLVMPALAGLHIVEARKKIYAGIKPDKGSRVLVRGRMGVQARPVPNASSAGS